MLFSWNSKTLILEVWNPYWLLKLAYYILYNIILKTLKIFLNFLQIFQHFRKHYFADTYFCVRPTNRVWNRNIFLVVILGFKFRNSNSVKWIKKKKRFLQFPVFMIQLNVIIVGLVKGSETKNNKLILICSDWYWCIHCIYASFVLNKPRSKNSGINNNDRYLLKKHT